LDIQDLGHSELVEAAILLSRGMRDNPNNIAAFGPDPNRRQKAMARFFHIVLRGLSRRGVILGAFDHSALVGVCGMAAPGECQPGLGDKLKILGRLLTDTSPAAAWRLSRWAAAWSRQDPTDSHWHLGPVAVDAHLQGRGVGGALMTTFCQRMDDAGAFAYME
jgi:hypothetical protein